MINLKKCALGAAVALMASTGAYAETVTVHSPENFQVLALSPNGKWACGVFVDAFNNTFGFRWNLEGGSIQLLGNGVSTAWDVSNDGTVSGDFDDPNALPNGAPVVMPGFWRDGAWVSLEMPEGNLGEGMGAGISPDGQYMVGSIESNGYYTSYIWKNGKLHRALDYNNHNVFYAVAPDGDGATGWVMKKNRTATYWGPDNKLTLFTDSKDYSYSPWNYGRNFSPDGSKLVYWGGWQLEDNNDLYLWAMYDVKNDKRIKVKAPAYESDLEFFDVSNEGLLVGLDRGRGYIWKDGEGMYIDDYFAKRGVDLSSFDDFYSGEDGYIGQLPIFRVVSVSEDESVLAMQYYDKQGQVCSLIVKMDQDLSQVKPVELAAAQLAGLTTVQLKWKRPVGVSSIRGYNVYRDGKKVNGFMALNVPYFYDRNLAPGTYTYEVSAVTVAGVETKAEPMVVEVSEVIGNAPSAIYARQKGVNNAHVSWNKPFNNGAHKNYFDLDNKDYETFMIYEPLEVELGIAFDKAEMANYAGYKISEVSFVPMTEQAAWAVKIYARNADGTTSLLATQPINAANLKYRELNTIKFTTPVDIPSEDLVVVIDVITKEDVYDVLGTHKGAVTPGYSDLLRQKGEPTFMSAYESSVETGWSITAMSWAIDLGLTPADYDENTDRVLHYNIYADGEKAGESQTGDYVIENLADGKHTVEVEAVYDSSTSVRKSAEVEIAANYIAVNDVTIKAASETGNAIVARWEKPSDNDLTAVTYTTAKRHASGLKGHESNGYAIMAAAEYPASMVRGYNGYRLNSLKFYPLADAIFTFMLYENDVLVYEYEVPEFNLKQWNEYIIDDEVLINENATYRLVVDCFDPEPDVPVLAIDNDMPRSNFSDLYSTDNGETWNSATIEAASHGNWMIGMTIADTKTAEVSVEGYDVVIDGKTSNTSMITSTSYTHDFGPDDNDAKHRLKVNVYYPTRAEAVEGNVFEFKISVLGVKDNMIANIVLRQGSNFIVADGEGVNSMAIYSTSGAQVAAVSGNRADISGLSKGIYIVKVNANGKNLVRKINIIR